MYYPSLVFYQVFYRARIVRFLLKVDCFLGIRKCLVDSVVLLLKIEELPASTKTASCLVILETRWYFGLSVSPTSALPQFLTVWLFCIQLVRRGLSCCQTTFEFGNSRLQDCRRRGDTRNKILIVCLKNLDSFL